MIVVAVASGTSADGLDVGVLDLDWDEPGTIALRVLESGTRPWPDPALRDELLALLPPATTTAAELCRLDTAVGQAVAEVAAEAVATFPEAALVVSPGQTVHHEVVDGRCLGTLQIGQPAWIAERTGRPVVSDLRARDVAAGGHGAPLAGTLDALWLAGPERRAALNLGGIANVSVVGPDGVLAWDTGPANCLLDVVAARASGGRLSCDLDGAMAAHGRVDERLLARLLQHPHLGLPPPASTGREAFSAAWLDGVLAAHGEPVAPDDLAATLVELTAGTVAQALAPYGVVSVVAAGGGVRNPTLLAALRRRLDPVPVVVSDDLGLPAGAKEVAMWGLLGFLAWHGCPGTRAATGATGPRILGRFSPGAGPLVLPSPAGVPARRLIIGG